MCVASITQLEFGTISYRLLGFITPSIQSLYLWILIQVLVKKRITIKLSIPRLSLGDFIELHLPPYLLRQVGIQHPSIPHLDPHPELLRPLVKLPPICTPLNRIKLPLPIVNRERIVEDKVFEDSVEFPGNEMDRGTVPGCNSHSDPQPP